MKEVSHKITTNRLVKKYGKKYAIIYCDGRIDAHKKTIKDFEDNGSNALLAEWEEEFQEIVDYWKEVKDIISGKKKNIPKLKHKTYKQKRDGITREELLSFDKKELKRLLKGFDLYRLNKEYTQGGTSLKVGDYVKLEEFEEMEIFRVLEKDSVVDYFSDHIIFRKIFTHITDINKI